MSVVEAIPVNSVGEFTKTVFERQLNAQGFPEVNDTQGKSYHGKNYGYWLRIKNPETFDTLYRAECERLGIEPARPGRRI